VRSLKELRKEVAVRKQRGEMPIGPILIIALIVLPLVIALVVYGGQISTSFQNATKGLTDNNKGAKAEHDKAVKGNPP